MEINRRELRETVDIDTVAWGDCFVLLGLIYMAVDISCFYEKKDKLYVNLESGVVEDLDSDTRVYPIDLKASYDPPKGD